VSSCNETTLVETERTEPLCDIRDMSTFVSDHPHLGTDLLHAQECVSTLTIDVVCDKLGSDLPSVSVLTHESSLHADFFSQN
jgi:hypothetical protein